MKEVNTDDLIELEKTRPGFNKYLIYNTEFEVSERFKIVDPMGYGAYGVVVAAQDL